MIRFVAIALLAAILAGCGGGNIPLPFSTSPLDTTKTTWSVEVHIQDYPTLATFQNIRSRLRASMVRIDYAPAQAGNGFYDQLVANAKTAGLRLDLITPYPVAPFDPVAYGAAAGVGAKRYAGQGIVWELINEPDYFVPSMTLAQCIAIETAAAKAIRAADPTAVILTGGTSGVDVTKGFPYAYALGRALAPYVDGVGIHPYGIAPSAFASEAADASDATGKAAYITEWGAINGVGLADAMQSARGHTAMFNAYEYHTQSGEQNLGIIDNATALTTYATEASQPQ